MKGHGTMTRLLMIEDDRALAEMVATYLSRAGMTLDHRESAEAGLAAALQGSYDAVVLDLMLPDGDGLAICRAIRARSDVPILMLTARGEEADRIVGLEIGADDYLPKPFNPRELLARLRAILRRRGGEGSGGRVTAGEIMRFGRLTIDRAARRISVDGEERPLTGHQFDLLCALAESAGRVLSREQLMDRVRGEALEAFDRSIDVHISRIRAVIEDDVRDGHALLRVSDRGPGVPEAERERIFEPFYRQTGRRESVGDERGVGLGLSLVRQIARRHGGDATCRPRDGGGACFEVNLPTQRT